MSVSVVQNILVREVNSSLPLEQSKFSQNVDSIVKIMLENFDCDCDKNMRELDERVECVNCVNVLGPLRHLYGSVKEGCLPYESNGMFELNLIHQKILSRMIGEPKVVNSCSDGDHRFERFASMVFSNYKFLKKSEQRSSVYEIARDIFVRDQSVFFDSGGFPGEFSYDEFARKHLVFPKKLESLSSLAESMVRDGLTIVHGVFPMAKRFNEFNELFLTDWKSSECGDEYIDRSSGSSFKIDIYNQYIVDNEFYSVDGLKFSYRIGLVNDCYFFFFLSVVPKLYVLPAYQEREEVAVLDTSACVEMDCVDNTGFEVLKLDYEIDGDNDTEDCKFLSMDSLFRYLNGENWRVTMDDDSVNEAIEDIAGNLRNPGSDDKRVLCVFDGRLLPRDNPVTVVTGKYGSKLQFEISGVNFSTMTLNSVVQFVRKKRQCGVLYVGSKCSFSGEYCYKSLIKKERQIDFPVSSPPFLDLQTVKFMIAFFSVGEFVPTVYFKRFYPQRDKVFYHIEPDYHESYENVCGYDLFCAILSEFTGNSGSHLIAKNRCGADVIGDDRDRKKCGD